jgi:predicted aspartyl protease
MNQPLARGICSLVLAVGFIGFTNFNLEAQGSCGHDGKHSSESLDPHGPGEVMGFQLYRDYLIVTCGTIGNLTGLRFLIDTGTDPSLIDKRLARKLRLSERAAQIALGNRTIAGQSSFVEELSVGPLTVHKLPVLVSDLSFLQEELSARIDAVIGLDVLGQMPFVIDYSSRQIRFGPVPAMPRSVSMQRGPNFAMVKVQVNHHEFSFLVDTGASHLLVLSPRAREVFSRFHTIKEGQSRNLYGNFALNEVYLQDFRLGDFSFGGQSAYVLRDSRAYSENFDGLLNPARLGFKQVSFDFARRVLAWK